MTKRERVERTINLKEVDRVPIYDLLRCDKAIEYFSGEKISPYIKEKNIEKLNEITGKAVNRLLDMTRSFGFGEVEERIWEDEYGFVWHSNPYEKTSWIEKRPFKDEKGGIEFIKKLILRYRNEMKEIKENQRAYRENYHKEFLRIQSLIGETVYVIANQGTGLDTIRYLLGLDLFSYIYFDNPEIISEFLEVYTDLQVLICHTIADRKLSPVVFTYGDIACKNKLLHSPEFLRKEFFPRLKKIQDAWHNYGIKCLFHSDGYLMDVMDGLIESGIDGLNPIEVNAGMNLKEIKEKYGDKIFLAGGIDMSQLLSLREPEEVKEIVRKAIRDCYPGYFVGSTTELDNAVKLENIIAIYEVVMEGV